MAGKPRVHELAKELGVESKIVLAKLQEMGEYVKSASSTIEAPVARRLRATFDSAKSRRRPGRPTVGARGHRRAAGRRETRHRLRRFRRRRRPFPVRRPPRLPLVRRARTTSRSRPPRRAPRCSRPSRRPSVRAAQERGSGHSLARPHPGPVRAPPKVRASRHSGRAASRRPRRWGQTAPQCRQQPVRHHSGRSPSGAWWSSGDSRNAEAQPGVDGRPRPEPGLHGRPSAQPVPDARAAPGSPG